MVAFLATLLIAVVMMVVSYVLMPKPKAPKPEAAKQMDDPIAEAGKERPVIFGTGIVKELNCLWFGDKRMHEYEVKA
jgi:preprotein translocase subunit YajC